MKKDILIPICILIALGAVAFAVYSLEKQNKLSKGLAEERYLRMVAEESSQKSAAKLAAFENQIKSTGDKMAKMKDILDQEKGVNSDLKTQYERLAKTKEELEAKLNATLEEKAAVEKAAQSVTPPAEVPVASPEAQ